MTKERLVEEGTANTQSKESLATNQETYSNYVEWMTKKQPTCLKDYVLGERLSDEEETSFFTSI